MYTVITIKYGNHNPIYFLQNFLLFSSFRELSKESKEIKKYQSIYVEEIEVKEKAI